MLRPLARPRASLLINRGGSVQNPSLGSVSVLRSGQSIVQPLFSQTVDGVGSAETIPVPKDTVHPVFMAGLGLSVGLFVASPSSVATVGRETVAPPAPRHRRSKRQTKPAAPRPRMLPLGNTGPPPATIGEKRPIGGLKPSRTPRNNSLAGFRERERKRRKRRVKLRRQ